MGNETFYGNDKICFKFLKLPAESLDLYILIDFIYLDLSYLLFPVTNLNCSIVVACCVCA